MYSKLKEKLSTTCDDAEALWHCHWSAAEGLKIGSRCFGPLTLFTRLAPVKDSNTLTQQNALLKDEDDVLQVPSRRGETFCRSLLGVKVTRLPAQHSVTLSDSFWDLRRQQLPSSLVDSAYEKSQPQKILDYSTEQSEGDLRLQGLRQGDFCRKCGMKMCRCVDYSERTRKRSMWPAPGPSMALKRRGPGASCR